MLDRPSLSDTPTRRWHCRELAGLALAGLLGVVHGPTLAQARESQQTVYRCGQAYTNAPPAGASCERLSGQQVTVIEGTRVQRPPAAEVSSRAAARVPEASVPQAAGMAAQPAGPGPAQAQRDEQARTVLLAEYERTRERLHALQLEQRQLQMTTPAADVARQQALEQALARTQRDLHSLQRELDRKPPAGGSR